MIFDIQYHNTQGPCPGGHTCDTAVFDMIGNITVMSRINLNNLIDGGNRFQTFTLSPIQCYNIAYASGNNGRVQFKYVCALANGCHTGVSWTKMTRRTPGQADQVVYNGCPKDNFIILNPCTGVTYTSMQ